MSNVAFPLAALLVAMGSIAIAAVGSRRQIHRDYTSEQASRIDELEQQVANLRTEVADVREENASLKRDNRKLHSENLWLMRRLIKLENGADPS